MKRYKILKEQSLPEESYYKISPQEYEDLMKYASYYGKGVTKIRKFGGKPLWITGNVKLSNTPTESLGNVGYIQGNLDISNTKISDLGDTIVKGYVSDYGTPLDARRKAAVLRRKYNDMDEYRESDDWNLDNPDIDDVGLKANALFEYLVGNNDLESLSDEEKERVVEIRGEIERLETEKQNLSTDDEDWNEKDDEYQNLIDELQEELDELIDGKDDVYSLFPTDYTHYGLQVFEVLNGNQEYSVGTEDEMDEAALEYAKSYIDDAGIGGFSEGFISDYIDTDSLKSYFEDWWRDDIYQNPDVYFSEDDFELTPEQEKRIADIESEIEDYEYHQSELDPNQGDYDELYDDFQNLIDELQSEKDDIVPDTDSPTDEMVEEVLEDRLYDVERNPLFYIKEYDLDISHYIDEDELAKGLVDSDGYGIMSHYDGSYDYISINGEDYYILRIN